MAFKTIVTFANFIWETGRELLDVEISLGSADKSSSCKITIADPMHTIAAAVINHSIESGGIQAIPDINKQPVFNPPGAKAEGSPNTAGSNTTGTVATGEQFTAEVKAFADAVQMHESPYATTDTAKSYRALNAGSGLFTDADVFAGGGFPRSAGKGQNVGRYQFKRLDWAEAKAANPAIQGFTPLEQDLVFLHKINRINRGGKELRAGDVPAAFKKAAGEWTSIPGGPEYQRQSSRTGTSAEILQQYYNYYAQRLAYYKGGTVASAAKVAPITTPVTPSATDTSAPVIKGSAIVIQVAGIFYEFLHQGTEMSEAGITILIGQGARWLMSRRKRSATYKDLSLSQLADKIGKEHKVKVDYQSNYNPNYSHLDQSGISDYQLLLREVEANGLMVTEDKTTLVIKERKQLSDSKLVLTRGVNLISYKITDRAIGTHEDEISKLLPQSAKTTIDPVAGKTQAIIKDIDSNATANKPTGKSKPATAGTLKGGQATQLKERAATKRIAGLPSIFVIPLTAFTLGIAPISTAVTQGLPGVLDRLWVVKKVTHKIADNTTTLDMVSPVEVIDINPVFNPPGAKAEPGTANGKGWIYPCSGTVKDLFGMRIHPITHQRKMHGGIDIANAANTPIYAAQSGVVTFVGDKGQGGGNQVDIRHEGEYSSYATRYLHNTSIIVAKDDKVLQGQQIAFMGSTGGSTGSHCHFSVKFGDAEIDPATIWTKLTKGNQIKAKEAV